MAFRPKKKEVDLPFAGKLPEISASFASKQKRALASL